MVLENLADEGELKELLIRLVRAPSHPGITRQEEAVVKEMAAYLGRHGIESEITEIREGRPNLVASVNGREPGRHLLLCGHTDTVPPNARSTGDPFSAHEVNGRLYGRGTADMKGALAAMAGALVSLRNAADGHYGRVTLAAVIDEEMESLGAEALIRTGFKADAAIIGEPTRNEIAIGHKGLEWLQIDFEGRAAHGGTPESGINAISAAAQFVHLVEQELVPAFLKRRDPVLGLPVINLGTISGGDQPSTVAAHCRIQLDRRWVTTETIDMVFSDLEGLLHKVREARPGLKTKISRVPGGMATMLHGPTTIDPGHAIVRAAQQAFSDLDRPQKPLGIFPAWTDGSLLAGEAHIPTVIWGPGELNCAHSPEENIRWEDVVFASRLYALAARHFVRNG